MGYDYRENQQKHASRLDELKFKNNLCLLEKNEYNRNKVIKSDSKHLLKKNNTNNQFI